MQAQSGAPIASVNNDMQREFERVKNGWDRLIARLRNDSELGK